MPLVAAETFPRARFVIDSTSRRGTFAPAQGHTYYAGYALEANGSEIVCSVGKAPGAGACWPLVLNQKESAPVELEAECRFEEDVGGQVRGSGQVYLYADLCFADGSRQDGYHVDYEKDPKLGWKRKKLLLDVGRPIRSASVYVFARYAKGLKARFRAPSWVEYKPVGTGAFALDGVSVLNAKRLKERTLFVRDVAKDDGYAEIAGVGGSAKGISVRVKSAAVGDVTHYDIVAVRAAHPGAQVVLDSSTVPSTPDGSSPAWNAIRAIRRLVDGKTVFWKTIADRYSYLYWTPLYWTPDQGKEDKVAPAAAYPDGRFALMEGGKYYWANRVREQTEWVKALRGQTVDIAFLGDSQTHFLEGRYGRRESPWPSVTAFMKGLKTLNLGIGGDRVEHALWRAKNGQLDGYRAKCVSILIGSNSGGKLRGPDGKIRKDLACDGVHLNDEGYRIWLDALKAKSSVR